jgi:hypothetical protein
MQAKQHSAAAFLDNTRRLALILIGRGAARPIRRDREAKQRKPIGFAVRQRLGVLPTLRGGRALQGSYSSHRQSHRGVR